MDPSSVPPGFLEKHGLVGVLTILVLRLAWLVAKIDGRLEAIGAQLSAMPPATNTAPPASGLRRLAGLGAVLLALAGALALGGCMAWDGASKTTKAAVCGLGDALYKGTRIWCGESSQDTDPATPAPAASSSSPAATSAPTPATPAHAPAPEPPIAGRAAGAGAPSSLDAVPERSGALLEVLEVRENGRVPGPPDSRKPLISQPASSISAGDCPGGHCGVPRARARPGEPSSSP